LYQIKVEICGYDEWVGNQFEKCLDSGLVDEKQLSGDWLVAYVESLGQKRRDIAPIDEPCGIWINELLNILAKYTNAAGASA